MKIFKCLKCAAIVISRNSNKEEVGSCPYCGADNKELEEL